jgi:hypothetical protein
LVEIDIYDERGAVTLTLNWKKRSKEVCYRFSNKRIARASFKVLARVYGVQEDTWERLGI